MNSEVVPTILSLRNSGLWRTMSIEQRKQRVSAELLEVFAEVLAEPMGPDVLQQRIRNLGVDSLDAYDIEATFEQRTGMVLDPTRLLADMSLEEVVDGLLVDDAAEPGPLGAVGRKDFSI